MVAEFEVPPSSSRQVCLDQAHRHLKTAGREAPRRTVEWLLMEVLGCDRGQLYARSGRTVDAGARRRFESLVERCVEGEPLQHVLGYTSFRGLRIDVSPAVMIPRPETEEVTEAALRAIQGIERPRVLDVGTGSGCIAIALKHERPDASVQAWDVSSEALVVARENARRHDLEIDFSQVDLFGDLEAGLRSQHVDLLVSNPPYIPDEEADSLSSLVREYDPPVALFTGDDPVRFYRSLAEQAPMLCTPGAAMVLEVHADYAEAVAEVLETAGLRDVRVDKDLNGRPRILTARMDG